MGNLLQIEKDEYVAYIERSSFLPVMLLQFMFKFVETNILCVFQFWCICHDDQHNNNFDIRISSSRVLYIMFSFLCVVLFFIYNVLLILTTTYPTKLRLNAWDFTIVSKVDNVKLRVQISNEIACKRTRTKIYT